MSKNKSGRPIESQTTDLIDVVKKEMREFFVVDGKTFKMPPTKEINDILVNHKRLKKYNLNVKGIKLAINRHLDEIVQHFKDDSEVMESITIEKNVQTTIPVHESTKALLNCVLSNYSVTMLLDQPFSSKIFEDIRNRDDLKAYKKELTTIKIYYLLRNNKKMLCERRKLS